MIPIESLAGQKPLKVQFYLQIPHPEQFPENQVCQHHEKKVSETLSNQ